MKHFKKLLTYHAHSKLTTHESRLTSFIFALALRVSEADEVFVVRVHVGQLEIDQQAQLLLHLLLPLTDLCAHNPLRFFPQARVAGHSRRADVHHFIQFRDHHVHAF